MTTTNPARMAAEQISRMALDKLGSSKVVGTMFHLDVAEEIIREQYRSVLEQARSALEQAREKGKRWHPCDPTVQAINGALTELDNALKRS